jgi:predicted hotdog family 3-hydroxylacyl-ACP dehydratase
MKVATMEQTQYWADMMIPPIEDLLPHRGTMLLTDAVLACGDADIVTQARVDSAAWYADDMGAMPAWIGIELMAQAIAAHVGLLAMRAGGTARPGVLLGSSKFEALTPSFARDATLRIHATEVLRGEQGHGAYECAIETADAQRLAQAVIKVFQPADFQAFIEGRQQ